MNYAVKCIEAALVKPIQGFVRIEEMRGFFASGTVEHARQFAYAKLLTITNHVDVIREQAEKDERWKQIIPYVIVEKASEPLATPVVLAYRRPATHTDVRLASKVAIGFGGHLHAGEGIWDGMRREMQEELGRPLEPKLYGVVNHDSDPVGRVHIGIVYRLVVSGDALASLFKFSEEICEPHWANLSDIVDQSEGWSQIIAKALC